MALSAQEVADYLKKHDIERIISDAVLDAVTAQSSSPLLHIAEYLKEHDMGVGGGAGGELNKRLLRSVSVAGKPGISLPPARQTGSATHRQLPNAVPPHGAGSGPLPETRPDVMSADGVTGDHE